jgi:hypothetical protein
MFLPQPNSEDYPKKCFAMGPLEPSKNNKIFRPTAISNRTICNSSKEREKDHGPGKRKVVEWRTRDSTLNK